MRYALGPTRQLRILVADDHESVRKGVCAILTSRLNIEVCGEASNGQEAIEKVQELRPDLIILDITMPVLGGLEAARIIGRAFQRPADTFTLHA